MDRRTFIQGSLNASTLAAAVAAVPAGAQAQPASFKEGKHYTPLLSPQPVKAPGGKIEVVEFFWYGCPHCYAFEPMLDAWARRQPADVAFRRVHVGFRPSFEPQQRLHLTLEAMGKMDSIHRRVFSAIHQQGQRLGDPAEIFRFMEENGVDRTQFTQIFNSFEVGAEVRRGAQLANGYGIDGVPSLGVHGRFFTAPYMVSDGHSEDEAHARVLQLVDQLVARVRRAG